jgi:hypothetical protein
VKGSSLNIPSFGELDSPLSPNWEKNWQTAISTTLIEEVRIVAIAD